MFDYIFEIVTLLTAMASLITAIIAINTLKYTRKSIEQQQEYNKNAILPIGVIDASILKESLLLSFRNNGTGPMRILEVSFLAKSGNTYSGLRTLLRTEFPEQHKVLDQNPNVRFITDGLVKGYVIKANDYINFLSFKLKENGDINSFKQARLLLMGLMGELVKVEVKYEGMYRNEDSCEYPFTSGQNHFKQKLNSEKEDGDENESENI